MGPVLGDEDIRDLFEPLGPVSIRRMFSGKAIYFQDVIIAIIFGDELRLKADAISAPAFEAAGATQWVYESHRGEVMMPYWSTPHEAFDDPDIMGSLGASGVRCRAASSNPRTEGEAACAAGPLPNSSVDEHHDGVVRHRFSAACWNARSRNGWRPAVSAYASQATAILPADSGRGLAHMAGAQGLSDGRLRLVPTLREEEAGRLHRS